MADLTATLSRQSKSILSASLRRHQAEPPIVSLDLPELDRYHDRAEHALTATIAAYGQLGHDVATTHWKYLRSRHGIRLFRGRYLNCDRRTPLFCMGTLYGRFDDVLEGIYCDNTEDMTLMNAIKCPRLAESAVLYAVQKTTTLDPYAFTGIKWTTIKLPVGSNRDLCYFDKMGMVRQKSGKRLAYHVMQSVDLSQHAQKSTHKREKVSLCYLFEELVDGLIGVYMQGEINYIALSYFVRIAVSDVLLAQITGALDCARAKKLALMISATPNGVPPAEARRRKTCYVCKGRPPFFENNVNCAGCNECVCKKCRCRERALVRDTGSSLCVQRAEFCSVCISKINLSSLDHIRVEATGEKMFEQIKETHSSTFCKIDEETEDVNGDIQNSHQMLASFVHRVSIQMQELNTGSDYRASNLSSIGKTSLAEEYDDVLDSDSEDEDVLNASRLGNNQFVTTDKTAVEFSRRSNSTTFRSSSSFCHDEDDVEFYPPSLFEKLDSNHV
ncbi:hypothetical protein AM587_10008225 [Phytophthora nicotianae]|uniref:FYVE-type domain-containing protein n=2 Tax=Phytophthora nicotianae TaxID=4792 RepID=V9FIG6_PHYNI|nr:hypothetical protein F443_05688 [Phytophthora nicotianae P1569]KUG00117.1 hypothetical protein AM587_10008225 [Phytophthora nicotianae]